MGLLEGYAGAILEIAKTEGQLERLSDELFVVARGVEQTPQLREALEDRRIPAERRTAIIEELLSGKAAPLTTAVVELLVILERSRELPAIADQVASLAAAERQKVVAEVRSAFPLDSETVTRLERALSRATERDVEAKVVVDPAIGGGIVAKVGDMVIDGSVRSHLEGLRQALR